MCSNFRALPSSQNLPFTTGREHVHDIGHPKRPHHDRHPAVTEGRRQVCEEQREQLSAPSVHSTDGHEVRMHAWMDALTIRGPCRDPPFKPFTSGRKHIDADGPKSLCMSPPVTPPPSQICSLQVGNTSMIMAAQNGYTEIAALLQEKGAVKVSHNSMLALPVCSGACG